MTILPDEKVPLSSIGRIGMIFQNEKAPARSFSKG